MREPGKSDVTVMLDPHAPYVSGLTDAARLTAEGPAARGPHREADTTFADGGNMARLPDEADDNPHIRFAGLPRGEAARDFHSSVDVLRPPTTAESFGIVRVEATTGSVPPAGAELPGSRCSVVLAGFERLVPRRDPTAPRTAFLEMAEPPAEEPLLSGSRS